MVVIHRQSALPVAATAVSFESSADRASAILLVEKGLVLLDSPSPAGLGLVVQPIEAIPAKVLAVGKGRKLTPGLLPPTPKANRPAVPNALVSNLMETAPDQVRPHSAKTDTSPSGHFAQRQAFSEQGCNRVHPHYLKGKQ
jgi:hypothetical protein